MKTIANMAPNASQEIVDRAISCGIRAEVIQKSKPGKRIHHPWGSTYSPQKIALINGVRMSLAQARQYVDARSS